MKTEPTEPTEQFKVGQHWLSGNYVVEVIEIDNVKDNVKDKAYMSYCLRCKYLKGTSGVGAWNLDGTVCATPHPEDLKIQISKETHPEYYL